MAILPGVQIFEDSHLRKERVSVMLSKLVETQEKVNWADERSARVGRVGENGNFQEALKLTARFSFLIEDDTSMEC